MFELNNSLKITKDLLLSKNSQETYFEHYLGIPVRNGLFCSPALVRVGDKNPTCAFYKNKSGILKYKDFAGPTFDFVGCVMHLYSCSYYDALRIIANDFGFLEIPKMDKNLKKTEYSGYILKETEKAKIQVEVQEFTEKQLKWWSSFGISKPTLIKYKVYSIKSIFLNGEYFGSFSESSPIYGYYGGTDSDGYELWRIYMPTKRKYRFISNWPSIRLQGARQLPRTGTHCILIKSMKDTMVLHEFGIIACSTTSENILISESQYSRMSSKFSHNILVFFDNDRAGVIGANKYKKKYGTRCIFIKRKYAKDISDLYKKVSANVFWGIIEELNNIIMDTTIRKTKHFYVF